jgi:hypothetical protein
MNDVTLFPPPDVLDTIRSVYAATLTVECSVWRTTVVTPGLSTGIMQFVKNTKCGVNLNSIGTSSPIINSILRAVSTKTPGARTLSFEWDDDVTTGDMIILQTMDDSITPLPMPTGVPRYRLGMVNDDDPLRFGLQAPAELQNVPN